MDDTTARLLDRLVDKTFESLTPDERLAFIEKLFLELAPSAQQDFLLRLAHRARPRSGEAIRRGDFPGMDQGPADFGPWQMCCRYMIDFVGTDQPQRDQLQPMTRLFTGLADETRLKILKLLSEGDHTVEELVNLLGIPQSTTSHHLRVLKEADLVRAEKRGRSVIYSLNRPLELQELQDLV